METNFNPKSLSNSKISTQHWLTVNSNRIRSQQMMGVYEILMLRTGFFYLKFYLLYQFLSSHFHSPGSYFYIKEVRVKEFVKEFYIVF
jgi:hypothetical protein